MDTPGYLRDAVTFLAGRIGVRTYRDTEKLNNTARYISEAFRQSGYEVREQSFLYDGRTYRNVEAELTGRTAPEKVLVVGAHYDTVRTTPGADDNASGVAGVLGLARLLAGKPLGKTVRFVAFALEEPPVYRCSRMGSHHYARRLRENNEQVEGMICLEMIGYYSDRKGSQHYPIPFMNRIYPNAGNFVAMVGNGRSRRFTKDIAGWFHQGTDLPVLTLNAPPVVIGIDFSDHWSFYQFGYKALMVTDTAFYRNPHYHAPSDLPQTLDYARMAKVAEGLKKAIEEWGSD